MNRKEYKRNSWEFKLEPVRLAALGGRPRAQIARELGIRVNQRPGKTLSFCTPADRLEASVASTGWTHGHLPRAGLEVKHLPCCARTVAKLMRQAKIYPR